MRDLRNVRIVCVATVPFHVVTQRAGQIAALLAAGMRVTLVCSPGPELERLPAHPNLEIHTLMIRRDIAPVEDWHALMGLVRLFRQIRPLIVHSTMPKAGLLTAVAGFLARVPIRLHTFTGQPWLGLAGPKRWVARLADSLIGSLNTYCYADGPSQRRFLVEEGLIAEHRIATICDGSLAGVDLHRFNADRFGPAVRAQVRAELKIGPESLVVLFIGRMARDKGIRELLDATRQLHAEGLNFCLVLVGPMDDEAGGRSTFESSEFNGLPYLRYIGYTPNPERFLCAADVFSLPSYREGFSTAVLEAGAMGLPTVGTKIYGLIDPVEDNETGLLVEPRNAGALADALRTMLTIPGLRKRLGRQARLRVVKLFAADRVNSALLSEYYRLLARLRG